ncbi:MAG: sensor histidine kinase [bacterium]
MAILISTVLTLVSIRKLNAHYAREQEATELARRAVGARDELLAIVSHDLRTPVQAIAIAANILSETGVSAAGRRPLTTIANATERMQYLIDELLEAAKFESGTFQLQRELCVASDMLDTTFSLFGERAARAGIALLAGKGSHREVSVDRERLLQVLSNLVSNAFKFTPAGGRVILSTEECGSSTKFVVEDTGSGISDDDVRHLFERYWQGRAKHRGSLGLGLYICGQIVNAHGGEIGVETRLGQGSTFWFTVPNSIS